MRTSRLTASVVAALAVAATGTAAVLVSGPSPQDEVLERLPELIAFVEKERGLEMRRDVPVEVLPDEAFVHALHEGEVAPSEEAYDLGATYDALGLVDDGNSLADDLAEMLDEDVLGFYDPLTERLVVRAGLDPAVLEGVLVHELTHALDDHWFHTGRLHLMDLTERALAFSALVEGSAVRVELAWWASRHADDDIAADVLDAPEVMDDADVQPGPPEDAGLDVLAAEADFPYDAGLLLVEALLEQGGQERLDEAFRFPPRTTEEVLHPELVGKAWPIVPQLPEGEGELVDEGVLGERGLALLLGEDPLMADGPQVGWEGDSYATYTSADGRTCTLASVHMEDERGRDRLVDALRGDGIDATDTGRNTLRLSACD